MTNAETYLKMIATCGIKFEKTPIQKDLQNLLSNKVGGMKGLVQLLFFALKNIQGTLKILKEDEFPSFEMIWLALVMKELHNQEWEPEQGVWIKRQAQKVPDARFNDVSVEQFFNGL